MKTNEGIQDEEVEKAEMEKDTNRHVRLSHTGKLEQAKSTQNYCGNHGEHRTHAHNPCAYVVMHFSSVE